MKSAARIWIWGILTPALLVGAGCIALGINTLSTGGDALPVGTVLSDDLTTLTQNPQNKRFRLRFQGRVVTWDRSPHDIDVRVVRSVSRLETLGGVDLAMHVQTMVSVKYSVAPKAWEEVDPNLRQAALEFASVPGEFAQKDRSEERIPVRSATDAARLLILGLLIGAPSMILLLSHAVVSLRRNRFVTRSSAA